MAVRRRLRVHLALIGVAAAGVSAPAPAFSPPSARIDAVAAVTGRADSALHDRVTDHVLVISIDGLRPDAIEAFGARTLQRLMREGRYSLTARTTLPSKTLPAHTSMLTGVEVDAHGITWNSDEVDEHGHVDVPTVFGLARGAGFRTAAFFSKTKFHHLEAPTTLDYVRSPKGGFRDSRWYADRTVNEVRRYLRDDAAAPNMLFVHIGEPDYAGHVFGWMGRVYGHAVRRADDAVARLLHAVEKRFGRGNFTVIVTADHGGHDRNHGSDDARDTTIPWIVWGEGVSTGSPLAPGIRTMDTAATALWLLGVDVPGEWVGSVVAGAFEPIGAAATSAERR